MNLLIFDKDDISSEAELILRDRRFEHIVAIHRSKVGDSIRVGELNGLIGTGIIHEIADDRVRLSYELVDEAPAALPITLVVSLPRPPTFKKILESASAMGVKKFIFINSKRVEQSYWQSPILKKENYTKHLLLGLEQSVDTVMPELKFFRGFKDFIAEAPGVIGESLAYVAHPYVESAAPRSLEEDIVLAIGPEGGFIDYEIDKMHECGFRSVNMGPRILRVEHAVSALLSSMVKYY